MQVFQEMAGFQQVAKYCRQLLRLKLTAPQFKQLLMIVSIYQTGLHHIFHGIAKIEEKEHMEENSYQCCDCEIMRQK